MCLEHRRTEGGVFDVFADIIECLKRVVVHVVHVVHVVQLQLQAGPASS